MPTLQDVAGELTGQIPGLPNVYARKFVNRAYEEIKREKLWSWNVGQGILVTPQIIQDGAGTVTCTQFSPTITFDATAITALAPYVLANPPLTKRQFRIMGGPVYSLILYNPITGVATLDRIYGENSVSGSMFSIYRCYYDAPSTDGTFAATTNDFLRHLSILNPIQGYTIAGRRLNMSQEELNRRDPMRGAQGNPYYAARYRPSPISILTGAQTSSPNLGAMIYELWPHPTFQMNLISNYERQHVDLAPGDYFPNQCSVPLVQYRTFEYAYRWAMQNAGRIPELKGVDWRFALSEVQVKYAKELVMAKKNDEEISLTLIRPGTAGLYDFWGPIDSNFFQSHGLPAL